MRKKREKLRESAREPEKSTKGAGGVAVTEEERLRGATRRAKTLSRQQVAAASHPSGTIPLPPPSPISSFLAATTTITRGDTR